MSFWTKCLIILGIIIGGVFLLAKSGGRSNKKNEEYKSDDNSELLRVIKSEPKIYNAVITKEHALYVSVLDDGTSRNGYAQYICEVVRDFNTDISTIKVVKHNSIKSSEDIVYEPMLGQSQCK